MEDAGGSRSQPGKSRRLLVNPHRGSTPHYLAGARTVNRMRSSGCRRRLVAHPGIGSSTTTQLIFDCASRSRGTRAALLRVHIARLLRSTGVIVQTILNPGDKRIVQWRVAQGNHWRAESRRDLADCFHVSLRGEVLYLRTAGCDNAPRCGGCCRYRQQCDNNMENPSEQDVHWRPDWATGSLNGSCMRPSGEAIPG